MRGDGDGWSRGPGAGRHWGRFGAAGLLVRAPLASGLPTVLLQHRAPWSHQGGTWALPGGARDSHETVVAAAFREAHEEAGIRQAQLHLVTHRVTMIAPGGWTYTTVVADATAQLATVHNHESADMRWVPEAEVDMLPLHPGFAVAWPLLRISHFERTTDSVAHTMERPDGTFAWAAGPVSE